jgi:hypothetical protein
MRHPEPAGYEFRETRINKIDTFDRRTSFKRIQHASEWNGNPTGREVL